MPLTVDQIYEFVHDPVWIEIRDSLRARKDVATRQLRECPKPDIDKYRSELDVIDSVLGRPEAMLRDITDKEKKPNAERARTRKDLAGG